MKSGRPPDAAPRIHPPKEASQSPASALTRSSRTRPPGTARSHASPTHRRVRSTRRWARTRWGTPPYSRMAAGSAGWAPSRSERPAKRLCPPNQAQQIAQQFLDENQSGSTTEAPDIFLGCYTLYIRGTARSRACCRSMPAPAQSGTTLARRIRRFQRSVSKTPIQAEAARGHSRRSLLSCFFDD